MNLVKKKNTEKGDETLKSLIGKLLFLNREINIGSDKFMNFLNDLGYAINQIINVNVVNLELDYFDVEITYYNHYFYEFWNDEISVRYNDIKWLHLDKEIKEDLENLLHHYKKYVHIDANNIGLDIKNSKFIFYSENGKNEISLKCFFDIIIEKDLYGT